jgi:hypothetical protein
MTAAIKIETTNSNLKISTQMKAVLRIFSADPSLLELVTPYIHLDSDSLDWDPIFELPLNSGFKAATGFAYAIWRDELRPRSNPFDGILNAEPELKKAVVSALACRWGLS